MRATPPAELELGRKRDGYLRSKTGDMHGAFHLIAPTSGELVVISSGVGPDNDGWEHVSVSLSHRTPNWKEMCWVKDLFWDEEEPVMQLHPPRSDYVNHHPYCLHMWRPNTGQIPLPPSLFVGPKQGAST